MMKAGFHALLLFFAVVLHFSANAQGNALVKDLHNDWLVFDDGQYVPYGHSPGNVSTVYFKLDAALFPGMHLKVSSPARFSIFINGQLSNQSGTPLRLNIDSLAERHGSSLLQLAIHQRHIITDGLFTAVIASQTNPSFGETLKPNYSAFRDFAIIGILVMLVMIITIIKLNPKLASDYFSISKIFSMREAEDGPSKSRITNSINILFYAYSSLMLGYFLMIVYHFLPHEYPTALYFQPTTFWDAILEWGELSLIVLALFFGKIVMVYGLSYIFGMKEIGSVHFFNWVRLLVGVFGVLTVIVFFYFIMRGAREGFYDFLLHAIAWVFAGWMVLIILKLQRQLQHSMFHLFSYICATELIPFLITVKVLYY
ncbi:MAG TPA: DUF4271 domain-containing protein [Chryseolinea sp.]|nr:DUF4271 domain-containing protein [Chryseolinea sp.]